jgi:ATP-dependent Clp protease adaptor protein ClpS
MLNVLVTNDEVTPTEFVVSVLQEVFGHCEETAERITLLGQVNGEAVCGVCRSRVEALDLIGRAVTLSRQRGYPLDFSISPVPVWRGVAAWFVHLAMKLAPTRIHTSSKQVPLDYTKLAASLRRSRRGFYWDRLQRRLDQLRD